MSKITHFQSKNDIFHQKASLFIHFSCKTRIGNYFKLDNPKYHFANYFIQKRSREPNYKQLFVNYFAVKENVLIFASRFKKNRAFLVHNLIPNTVEAISYKTVSASKETVTKGWVIVDAENETLGRLASNVAYILRGKDKVNFTPHVDTGDNVIIINAEKIKLTGNKVAEKEYVRHTGYPGGQRFATPKLLLTKRPTEIIRMAVSGMLPKNKLGDALRRNVFIYAGAEHPHAAQQPKEIKINTIK